jgi:hypothetical protein
LENFHEGLVGGHFGININVRKVLSSSYWWPTMHKDVVELCQNYDICQHLDTIWWSGKRPFKPIMAFEPFMKWGLDFMGLVKSTTRNIGNQYVIVVTNYATKWVEAKHFKTIWLKAPLNIFMNKILFTLVAQPIFYMTKVVISLIKLLRYWW